MCSISCRRRVSDDRNRRFALCRREMIPASRRTFSVTSTPTNSVLSSARSGEMSVKFGGFAGRADRRYQACSPGIVTNTGLSGAEREGEGVLTWRVRFNCVSGRPVLNIDAMAMAPSSRGSPTCLAGTPKRRSMAALISARSRLVSNLHESGSR